MTEKYYQQKEEISNESAYEAHQREKSKVTCQLCGDDYLPDEIIWDSEEKNNACIHCLKQEDEEYKHKIASRLSEYYGSLLPGVQIIRKYYNNYKYAKSQLG